MHRKNERGNVIVSLILVTLIGVFQTFYYFNSHFMTHSSNLRRYTAHESVREILFMSNELLSSPKSLIKSVQGTLNQTGGAELSRCFYDSAYDCPAAGGKFSIYYEDGTGVFSDAVDPDRGLTYALQPCSGYSNTQNSVCVLKLALTWKPTCPTSGPCYLPPITVQGAPQFKAGFAEKTVFNTDPYTFSKVLR